MADEQVGNSSYLTMTPGSAVAGQLQNILTQKRVEARQAMLDELNRKNVESEIGYRDENAKSLAASRATQEENRKAQELTRRAGLYSPHQAMDPTSSDYNYFQHNAPSLLDPGQEAAPQFDYEGQPDTQPTGPQFHGLPKDLEIERKDKLKEDAIHKLGGDTSKMSPLQVEMLYRAAYGGNAPTGIVAPKDPEPWEPIYDSNGQDTGNWAPKGAHFTPKEPRDPNPPTMTPFQGVDEAGNSVNLGYNPRLNSYEPAKLPPGVSLVAGSRGNAAPKAGPKPARTTTQTWSLWSQAVDKLQRSPGDPRVETDLNAQAAKIAQELGISPHARQAVLDAFRDPSNRSRTPKFAADGGATPADVAQAQELWSLLSNGFKPAPVQ